MDAAVGKKPIRGFRFKKEDTICTGERFNFLRDTFKSQFDGTEFPNPPGYHPSFFSNLTHRLHAVLTGRLR